MVDIEINNIDLNYINYINTFTKKEMMDARTEIAGELNVLLANYQIYYQNLRGFHWNIQGRDFFELHVKFEELYNDGAIKIDEVAERILTIEATPLHSFADYLETANLKAETGVHNGETAVKAIVDNLSAIVSQQKNIRKFAEDNEDGATADMMATFIEEQEKTLWMFKSWLK